LGFIGHVYEIFSSDLPVDWSILYTNKVTFKAICHINNPFGPN